ncbi:MAG: DUF2516 family protein [Mycobacteriales bacterium]
MAFLRIDLVVLVMWIGALLLQGFAAVHCLVQRQDAFPAADKWNKWGWTAITVVAFLVTFVYRNPINLLPLVGFIASCVYLVDVRPAVREISGGRGRRGQQDPGRW